MTETHTRSVIKGVTWRIIATVTTVTLVFIFTRSIKLSLGVGVIEVIAKIIFYYLHERLWNRLGWGRQ